MIQLRLLGWRYCGLEFLSLHLHEHPPPHLHPKSGSWKRGLFLFQLEVNILSLSLPGGRRKTKQAFGLSGPHTLSRDRSQHVWEHQRQCAILSIRRLTFTKVCPSACSQESSRQSQKGQLTSPICRGGFWLLTLEDFLVSLLWDWDRGGKTLTSHLNKNHLYTRKMLECTWGSSISQRCRHVPLHERETETDKEMERDTEKERDWLYF